MPANSIRRIIVTGSSGTIGTALCEALVSKGYQVIPIDLKPNKWNADINKKTLLVDIRDKSAVKKIPGDADLIIHFAANARVYDLVVEPSLACDNFTTTFNMLEFARQNKIPRFLFASSREVYGNAGKLSYREQDTSVENCESPYTASKVAGEALVHAYSGCYGLSGVIVRFSNVYGRYDDSDRVIPLFIRKAINNEDLVIFGRDKFLDFTFIDDAVEGVMLCIQGFDVAKGHTFNLATGEGTSIVRLAEMICKALQCKGNVLIEQNRTGEVVKFVADISNAKNVLGFSPKIKFEEGIQRAIAWYKEAK